MAIDKELIQAINDAFSGEESGFNTIYQKTYSYVYARCHMIMKNEDDAQELLQETYLQAYTSLDKLNNAEGIYAWLGSIAYNQGMKMFRKRKDVLLDEDGQGLFEVQENVDTSAIPGHEMELKETADIIKDIIEELPDSQRAVVTAYYYDEMSVSKIAELMDTSTGTIKSRLNYARKHIQEAVEAKEKKMGIKLHTAFIPALILAIRGKASAMHMPEDAVQECYSAVCSKSGISTVSALEVAKAGGMAEEISALENAGVHIADQAAVVTETAGTSAVNASTMFIAKIAATAAVVLGLFIGGKFVYQYLVVDDDTVAVINTEEQATEITTEATAETTEITVEEDTPQEDTTEDNSEETAMQQAELTKAKIRNAYMGAVWKVYNYQWLDGSELTRFESFETLFGDEDEVEDSHYGMEENTFAIADVTGDGNEELVINYDNTSMAGMRGGIYSYNAETNSIEELLYTGAGPVIYTNGIVEVNISHDSAGGGGDIWPHTLYKYNLDTKVFDEVGYVDDFVDRTDPSKITYTYPGSDESTLDEDSYKKWYNEFYGDAIQFELNLESISRENIKKYSLEYFEVINNIEQSTTPGVYDIGIDYIKKGLDDEHPHNILEEMKNNYALEVTTSEYEDADEVSYNGTMAFIFFNDDAGEILYQDAQVENIVMLGLYPGMDENEAYAKLESYGLYRIESEEASAVYVSGENADNISLIINAEGGKISNIRINFRPIIAG